MLKFALNGMGNLRNQKKKHKLNPKLAEASNR